MRAMTAGTGRRSRVAPAQSVAVQALRKRLLDASVAGATARRPQLRRMRKVGVDKILVAIHA